MIVATLLFLSALFLSYANGANDNFKGVATLFGSGTAKYKSALWWATVTTLAGSVCSIFLAESLIKSFSGKGLVPDALAASSEFLLTAAAGAGLTVMLATVLGLPISTTHSLTGALVGGGIAAVGSEVNFSFLGTAFFLPLAVSPFISLALSAIAYVFFRFCRIRSGVGKETCLCVGETERIVIAPQSAGALAYLDIISPKLHLGTQNACQQIYAGTILGINAQKALDINHFISAGVVSFARGLNDTPKIVAMLLALQALNIKFGMLAIALLMAAGGLINARKVALTMSKKITPLNHGQGFTANLVTGLLVVFASRFGLPVSTTHVSVGSLFGIGLVTKEGNGRMISGILISWFFTLPVAAIFSSSIYWLIGEPVV